MEPIPFARPYIGKEEEDAVLAVLRSGWLTTGRETLEFEKEFADFFMANSDENRSGNNSAGNSPLYCMAVNSATSGLHLALEAAGIGKGDIVLVPSMTFTATAEVARYLGADVVFIDVSKGSFHIDPAALLRTLERLSRGLPAYPSRGKPHSGTAAGEEGFGPRGKAKALIPVHYGGLPCDMNSILPIAKKFGLKVIEDAAHSFPAFIEDENNRGKKAWAGLMGNTGVFSFYATKTITTGEGGMVITSDRDAAQRIRIMRSHGIDRSIFNRYTDTNASWYYEVIESGFKYNIPDILSALGRVQLRRANELLSMRKELARMYDDAFKDDAHFCIPPTAPGDARHLYPLRLMLEKLSIKRNDFAAKIQEQGIGISVHFIPLHTMPYYKKLYNLEDSDFRETMDSYNRTISLPLWPGMSETQVKRVIGVVKTLAMEYNRG